VLIVVATVMMMGDGLGSGAKVVDTLWKVLGLMAVIGVPVLLLSVAASSVPHRRRHEEDED